MTIDIEPLRKTLGTKIEDEDVVTRAPLKAMIATFDRQEKAPEEGEPIAPGWHLCFLHSYARPAQLGRDGAAFTGGVLPEIPMPRRMYAGSTFTFDGDIRVGDKLKREIEFTDIQLREGSTGTLVVTTQTRRLFTPRGLALTEAASTVFREDPKPGQKSGVPVREAAPADVPWRRTITPNPVMLFRYSAITFNPHRIHYDRTYCMETEGYPGLVVHGPFAQQCIFDLLRDSTPGRKIKIGRRARPRAAVRHLAVRRDRPADRRRQRRGAVDRDAQGHDRGAGNGDVRLERRSSSSTTGCSAAIATSLSAPPGRNFDPDFQPRAHAGRDASTRRVRRQVHDRLPQGISGELVCESQALAAASRSGAQLFRRRRQPAAVGLAQQRLDPSRRPARLVPMVLPLLHGRRLDGEDERQIRRWRAFRRHVAQVRAHCEPGDPFCRPRQRQALLQWAYDSRKI